MLHVTDIPDNEIEFSAIRASGPGGQHVNKVSSAIHLQFDINASSLPDAVKAGLMSLHDSRISREGVVTIKAQRSRSQESNRADALARLDELLVKAQYTHKPRRPSKPSRGSVRRRLDSKTRHGVKKSLRRDVPRD